MIKIIKKIIEFFLYSFFLFTRKLHSTPGHELQVGSTVQCVVTLVGGKPSSPTLTMSGRGEDVRPALMAVREGGEGITPGSMLQGIVSAVSCIFLFLLLWTDMNC